MSIPTAPIVNWGNATINSLQKKGAQEFVQGQMVSFYTQNPEIDIETAMKDEEMAANADIINYGMVIREVEGTPTQKNKIYIIMTPDGSHKIKWAFGLRPVTADNLSAELLTGIFANRRFSEKNGNIIMEVFQEDLQPRVATSKPTNPSRK